jgi:DNA polymerase-3 subunit gamma/tau
MDLNLARKWRSKKFDELVGQDIIIKLLKNSLYKNIIFPAYLLAGIKGTGKTTIARIFSTALNCFNLKKFQEDPLNHYIPCLKCDSCISMHLNNHPDFIEIDAASNTGVDNIRSIIETVSFIPLIGKYKIYLIDEAHMLSKSAFNALLKILEEPNVDAVFILATTEYNKIIETVRSRCFQLIFEPLEIEDIKNQLQKICDNENIKYEIEALNIIAQESQGSLRDGINLLEKIRLYDLYVSKDNVFKILKYPTNNDLKLLLINIINENFKDLINNINDIINRKLKVNKIYEFLLNSFISILDFKMDIKVQDMDLDIINLTKNIPINKIIDIFHLLIEYENIIIKGDRNSNIKLLILNIYRIINKKESQKYEQENKEKDLYIQKLDKVNIKNGIKDNNIKDNSIDNLNNKNKTEDSWNIFLEKIKNDNQILYSILSNGIYKEGIVELDNNLSFAKEIIEGNRSFLKIAKDILKIDSLKIIFSNNNKNIYKNSIENYNEIKKNNNIKIDNNISEDTKKIEKSNIKNIIKKSDQDNKIIKDIDKDKFPKTDLLLKLFPGKLYEQ